MDLIIQPEEVGILARPISQHIDREQLVAYITEVEQLQIRSALGGVLFSNIKQSPSDFAIILNGGSDDFGEVSGGIRKAMAYYVYARVIREGSTIATRFGAVEKTDEYATRLEQERKNTIYRECNNIADAYMVEVVNYAKAQGLIDAQGVNSTRRMAYVVGGEEADANANPCKSRQSINAELIAGDGINIVDGEISVDMGEVQRGTGMTALAQRVTNAETNIEEVRRLATQREEITVGNGLIKDDKGGISVDFEVVASNAEITNIRTTANEAKTEAGQAKKIAENAISTLDAIRKIASDAETTAQSAKTEADSAVTTAVDAVGVASNALEKANQAKESANDALMKANSAQTSATNAENSAKSSAQNASSAKSSAEKAQASAEEVAKGIASIDGKVSESVSKAVDGAFNDVNEKLATKQQELTLTVLDNGSIRIGNLQGQTKDFMPATPSGDPMHYAYEAIGAEYNATASDKTNSGMFGDTITHKAGHWYLNEVGDLTNAEMRNIYRKGYAQDTVAFVTSYFRDYRERTNFSNTRNSSAYSSYNHFLLDSTATTIVLGKSKQIVLVNSLTGFMMRAKSCVKVLNGLKIDHVTNAGSVNNAFYEANALTYIDIIALKVSISFADSPLLSNASILYMINQEQSTSAITITLHADAYARAMADTSIQTALTEHPNVTLASA